MLGIVMASLSSFICPIMHPVQWACWAPWTALFILQKIHCRPRAGPLSCLLKCVLVDKKAQKLLMKNVHSKCLNFSSLTSSMDPIYSFMQAFFSQQIVFAANWMQQETLISHFQSPVWRRPRPLSSLIRIPDCMEKAICHSRGPVPRFL